MLALGLVLLAAILVQLLSALGLGKPDPSAQLRQAAALTSLGSPPDDVARGEALARQVLDRGPMEARVLSLLAQVREDGGKTVESERLMRAAADLSHRDALADLWLFKRGMSAKRYDDAFTHADALLRRDLDGYRPVMRALYAAAADDPAALAPLARRLALSPTWRVAFFEVLFAGPAQPFTYPLFDAMVAAGSPPTTAEMDLFLRRLVRDGAYEQAYLFWLLSLPRESLNNLGYVFNGDFGGPAMGEPFGWKTTGNAGGAASIETAPGGGKALLVSADGYTPAVFAQQLVVLPAGRYQLTGRVQAPVNAPVGVLAWTLTCLPKRELIMTVPAQSLDGGGWRRFTATFTVPAGCAGQMLTLRGEPGDRRTTLAVWYDDLAILPVRGAPAAEVSP